MRRDVVGLLQDASYYLYYVRKADAIGDEITSAENDMKFEKVATKICKILGLEYSDSVISILERLGVDDNFDSPKWQRITEEDIQRVADQIKKEEQKYSSEMKMLIGE